MFDRLMVTGGAGFIGSNFIRYVLERFPEVFILNVDALTYAGSLENLKNLPENAKYIFDEVNICNQYAIMDLLRAHNINTIIHFAAESHVDNSITNPYEFANTNIMGTFSMLESARNVWLKEKQLGKNDVRFFHISTDEVFGSLEPDEPAFTENNRYEPNSPYSASKAGADHLVRSYYHTYDLPITITNCSNNYGPYQFPEKLIPLFISNALQGKSLPIYGDGKQIRDWLYVEDHCEAIWKVLQDGNVGENYNIGGGNQPTNLEIIDTICSIIDELRPSSPYVPHSNLKKYIKDRLGHDRRYAMDITKISNELGWFPKHNLKDGLRKTVEWYLSNEEWVRFMRSRA